LHDSVQLALLRSFFPEATSLCEAFTGEGRAPSSMASESRSRRRRVPSVVSGLPCSSARNVAKEAPTPP
jgi:hypothetical protein